MPLCCRMSLVHIGPSRVELSTWEDLLTAAREGLLDETTFCELKKALGPSDQNSEISCDLAALSVLGGVLVVGVKDKGKNKAGEVLGIDDPNSQMTRLVALSESVVQPSLVCDIYVLNDPADETRGCVVCVVPPSASAPHRVRDVYWGRSSEGKRVLSDPEVADLFMKRRHRDDGFRAHLVGLAGDFDPIPRLENRSHGHLYFSASPSQPNPASTPPPWGHDEHVLRVVTEAGMPARQHGWGDLSSLVYSVPHPFGIMAESFDRAEHQRDEAYLSRLLIRDDGQLDFASGLGTVARQYRDNNVVIVPLPAMLSYLDECVRVTAHVAQQLALNGAWRLGVRVNQLLGVSSMSAVDEMRFGRSPTYPESEFVNVVDVTAQDLRDPASVVERLAKPLARGLGDTRLLPYEQVADVFRRR